MKNYKKSVPKNKKAIRFLNIILPVILLRLYPVPDKLTRVYIGSSSGGVATRKSYSTYKLQSIKKYSRKIKSGYYYNRSTIRTYGYINTQIITRKHMLIGSLHRIHVRKHGSVLFRVIEKHP